MLLDEIEDSSFPGDVGCSLSFEIAYPLFRRPGFRGESCYRVGDESVFPNEISRVYYGTFLEEGLGIYLDAPWNLTTDICVMCLVRRVSDETI